MNLLVSLLSERQDLAVWAVQGEIIPYGWLAESLSDDLFGSRSGLIRTNEELQEILSFSYLPVISGPQWDEALRMSDPGSDWLEVPHEPTWWEVMIPAGQTGLGITAPQDSSPEELVALFLRSDGSVVAFEAQTGRLVRGLSGNLQHCSPPHRGRCGPGLCGGCSSRRVYDERFGFGIACRCDDLRQE
jgi:hypothetical protein